MCTGMLIFAHGGFIFAKALKNDDDFSTSNSYCIFSSHNSSIAVMSCYLFSLKICATKEPKRRRRRTFTVFVRGKYFSLWDHPPIINLTPSHH